MCGETMYFPENPMEFIESYSFKDKKEVYTNGAELVSMLRVKQMIEHYFTPRNAGLEKRLAQVERERDAAFARERTHDD